MYGFYKVKKLAKKYFTSRFFDSIMQNTTKRSARCSKTNFSRVLCDDFTKQIYLNRGGFFIVALLILLIWAVVTDLSKTRVPNCIIITGLILGLFYRVLYLGHRNYIVILAGIVIPVLIFFPLFLMRAMGAGDIKLFAVTGAFFSIEDNMKCIALAIMLGGVIALIKVFANRNLRERLKYMFLYLGNVIRLALAGNYCEIPYIDREDTAAVQTAGIKFTVPVLLGVIVVMGRNI